MVNKLISINTDKTPGTQFPAVVNTEIKRVVGPTGGVDEAAVNALIDAKLTAVGPAIQQAVASQVGKLTDKATLNVSTSGDAPFTFETNNLTGAQPKVGIDFRTQRDGEVTVNGKRVLTTDDALANGSVDTTTLSNQLLMLQSRIDDLEAEMADRVTMANVQGLLTGFATAQQLTALTGRVTDLEGSTALKQARWVIEALTGDTTANATQINNAVADLVRVAALQNLSARVDQNVERLDSSVRDVVAYAQAVEQWANQTIGEVVQYIVEALDPINSSFALFGSGTSVEAVTEFLTQLNDEFGALKDQVAALPSGSGSAYGEWIAARLTGTLGATLAEVNRAVDALARKTDVDAAIAAAGTGSMYGSWIAQALTGTLGATLGEVNRAVEGLARKTDPEQIITAKSIICGGIKFPNGEILAPYEDEYGSRLRLFPENLPLGEEIPIVVVHTDLQEILAPRTGNDLELVDLVTEDMLNRGRESTDTGWANCQIVNGTAGTVPVQARVVGGVVQLQGDLKYAYTSSGTYGDVIRLPEGIPGPQNDTHFPIYGIESGVSYRIGLCRVQTNGAVQIAAPTGKVTAISFGNITWPVP